MACASRPRAATHPQSVEQTPGGWQPSVRRLPDARRWHLQQGPIDLVVEAEGEAVEVAAAIAQAVAAFEGLLETLVAELGELRRGREPNEPWLSWRVSGPVARRMCQVVTPYRNVFVTPMIAVAGAVADHVLAAMLDGRDLQRAYVNNGGDIALYLASGQEFSVALFSAGVHTALHRQSGSAARLQLSAKDAVGGIATSGWQGRSHSLGLADAVTVLARSAAVADVAATLIANAVDLPGCDKVRRLPANALDDASDLGCRPVTVDVGVLTAAERRAALNAGAGVANMLLADGRIIGCYLALQGDLTALPAGNRLHLSAAAGQG